MKSSLKRYKRLRKYAFMFLDVQIGMLVCSQLNSAASIISPFITKLTFDYAFRNKDLLLLIVLSGTGLVLFMFTTVSGAIQQYLQLYASQSLTFVLRSDLIRHMFKLPLSFFHSRSTGEHLYRLDADVSGAASFLGGFVSSIFSPITNLVFPLAAVLWLDWHFALLAIGVGSIYIFHSRYFGVRQRELMQQITTESQSISSQTTNRIAQIKLVKTFGREQREIRQYLSNQIKLIRLSFRQYWLNLKRTTTSSLVNTILQGGLSLYLGYQVISGHMTIGSLIALSMYFVQLSGAVSGLAGLYPNLLSQLVPVDRMLDILEMTEIIEEKPGAIRLDRLSGAISFRNVRFGYTPEVAILDRLNLTIHPGQMVAIVGPSGIGKTTILNLLLRLYDVEQGSVLIDGYDVRDLKLSYRSHIGVVLQESFLFNTTVLENIRYGNPSASEDDVIEAANLADAHEFISQLPGGYETNVGESGCNLSAGQRQRIGIARALVKKPKILVLDEATASLSTTSEATILDNLRPRADERTLIIITHRLATTRMADCIFVLDGGCVAEQGTHEELLAEHGLYRQLWECHYGNDVAGVDVDRGGLAVAIEMEDKML